MSLTLRPKATFEALQTRMSRDPQVSGLEIRREVDYWDSQSKSLAEFVTILGIVIAAVFSVAAILLAGVVGYAGGLLPAARATRVTIVRATRGG